MTEQDRICRICRTNLAGYPQNISFDFEGLPVTTFKGGLECGSCTQKEWEDRFTRYGRELITNKDGSPIVNWRLYAKLYEQGFQEEQIQKTALLY